MCHGCYHINNNYHYQYILKKFLMSDFGQGEINIENLPKVVDLMIIVNNILKHNFIVILILIGL